MNLNSCSLKSRLSPRVLKSIELAKRSDVHVLLTGPTGSGKTTLAREIHLDSDRRDRPFVVINLATLHQSTLESELFGHERGAYTGAMTKREGRLAGAQGGTVLLDEVAELPIHLQSRLLEVLQNKTVVPVGGNREIRLDIRILAATHQDLEKKVKNGEFREDLFHRLRVLNIQLPGLTWDDAQGDLDQLVHDKLSEICAEKKRSILGLSPEVAFYLESYPWPGNLRELHNVLETAVLSCEGGTIGVEDLPDWFLREHEKLKLPKLEGLDGSRDRTFSTLGMIDLALRLNFKMSLESFERTYFSKVLKLYGGDVERIAREIGLSRATVNRRLRALGISEGRLRRQKSLQRGLSSATVPVESRLLEIGTASERRISSGKNRFQAASSGGR